MPGYVIILILSPEMGNKGTISLTPDVIKSDARVTRTIIKSKRSIDRQKLANKPERTKPPIYGANDITKCPCIPEQEVTDIAINHVAALSPSAAVIQHLVSTGRPFIVPPSGTVHPFVLYELAHWLKFISIFEISTKSYYVKRKIEQNPKNPFFLLGSLIY